MDPAELRRVFQMFDRNGDGKITKQELAKSLENLGIYIPDDDLAQMIEKIDVNKDGFVDMEEFGELYQTILGERDEEEDMREAFNLMGVLNPFLHRSNFFSTLAFILLAESAPEDALVTHLPGFNGTLPSKHYAGWSHFFDVRVMSLTQSGSTFHSAYNRGLLVSSCLGLIKGVPATLYHCGVMSSHLLVGTYYNLSLGSILLQKDQRVKPKTLAFNMPSNKTLQNVFFLLHRSKFLLVTTGEAGLSRDGSGPESMAPDLDRQGTITVYEGT
nr:calmodulin-like protein 3 [Tanacetum cinerariifolium]